MVNSMMKFPLLFVFAIICAAPGLAQTGANYRSDNFDMSNGIRIESVPKTATLPPSKTVRPTVKSAHPEKPDLARPTSNLYIRPVNTLAMTISKSLDGFTTGNAKIDGFIVDSGIRNGVDPVLLYAIMHQESTFKQRAVSPKGARGLMQLMPQTAARFGVMNIFDPRQNIEGGARYVRFLLDCFDGDVRLALAGYNAGEGAVLKYGRRIPPYSETQEYVRRISWHYQVMRDPETARRAQKISPGQAVQTEQPVPLNTYERNVYAVRLPDGRLQLVSQ